jgi:hypothetical protein
VLRHGGLYTDKGFGEGIRYAQENDVEASVRLERHGAHIRLSVCGELRGFQRFDKLAHPLHFYTVYTFGDGPAFQVASAVETDPASTAKSAFLSLLLKTNGLQGVDLADANGQYLTGQRQDAGGRFAQLAQSETPQRLPTDLRLADADGVALRLGAMTWFGARPGNVFMHGEDLHLAWLDGSTGAGTAGPWRGVMCSVACEDALEADTNLPPMPQMVKDKQPEFLRDGGFETANASGTKLLSCGQSLPHAGSKPQAWSLPPGAEYVVADGNRCVLVTGDGLSYRLIRQAVAAGTLKPGSKWRLCARLKGNGVEPGDVGWKTACLRWSVSIGGRTTYTTVNLPQGDSPWQTWKVLLTVPEGVEQVAVEAGLNGNSGRMWIDDIRIEAAEEPSHE